MRQAVSIYPTAELAAEAAAARFAAAAERAIQSRGACIVVLAGGQTPRRLYELLATPRFTLAVDWRRVQVCWGDERCVRPDDEASNYRMAREALLSRVPVPAANVHRIRGEDDPAEEARRYERLLEGLLRSPGARLDLVLLGLGTDGHTASLFPGATAIHESERWVEPAFHEVDGPWRITCTPRVLNTAAEVLFLVSGSDKAKVVGRVLEGPVIPEILPAQLVIPTDGEVSWVLDRSAASGLVA